MSRPPRGPLAYRLGAGLGFGLLLTLAAAAGGCKPTSQDGPVRLSAGDAVWFEDGVATAADETESTLGKGGFASVFLPAVQVRFDGGRWTTRSLDPPAQPFARIPVHLVISAPPEAAEALHDPAGASSLADSVGLAAKIALRDGARFGRVRGIHIDVPFAPADAERFGAVLRGVRDKLPKEVLLTWSLRFPVGQEYQSKLRDAAEPADGAVAFLLGEDSGADPIATDQLGRPWLAAYSPEARGRKVGDETNVRYPEILLARMTNDPRVEFAHDLSIKDESASAFLLTAHQPITIGAYSFRPGDAVQFRQPSLSDMVFRLGADLAGRRFVRGRTVLLSGKTEADRIFTLAALNDILLGRSLNTDLRVSIATNRNSLSVSAENPTPHASLVSRTSNWVEVDLPPGGILDVRAGGFDRFEVFGASGEAVTLGLANRIRLFETLVGPWEKIDPAQITLRRPTGKGCCGHRTHVLSSAGAEVVREGDVVLTPSLAKP